MTLQPAGHVCWRNLGTDTTSAVMEWTMAEIMKNPRVMKKVIEEIRGITVIDSSGVTKLAGYHIPPKTTILINTERDHDLWDRPEEFVPERSLFMVAQLGTYEYGGDR
ncbi:hypothetical protein ACFE04_027771 [Oxalis oulophora]